MTSAPSRPAFEPVPLLGPLFGRRHERATIGAHLRRDDVRLVTLTGPGGVGKTRLARQTQIDLAQDFRDGVVWISLAAIVSADFVLPAVANALGMREAGSSRLLDRLIQITRPRSALLIFDNFEHVIAAVPHVVELLEACPLLNVLTTSRIALRVGGEHEIAIPPLPAPVANESMLGIAANPAVALFVRQAQRAQPRFVLTEPVTAAVAEICARLDGLPLALELAAARLNVLSPAELAARLSQRLHLLTGGPRDLPARQNTMRDAISWSHDLLSPEERMLFRRLAVFSGGWTIEMAEAICPEDDGLDVLPTLSSLVDQSLVQVDETGRITMLETVREYALEQLDEHGETGSLKARHASSFFDWAARLEPDLFGPDQVRALETVDTERHNLRAALAWFASEPADERRIAAGLDLAAKLWWFWQVRRPQEGRVWIDRLLAAAPDKPALTAARGRALAVASMLANIQHDYGQADEHAMAALNAARAANDRLTESRALFFAAMSALRRRDLDRAAEIAAEGTRVARQSGERSFEAALMTAAALVKAGRGQRREAAALIERAIELERAHGQPWSVAWMLEALAPIKRDLGETGAAIELLRRSAAIYRSYGDGWWLAEAITRLIPLLRGAVEPEIAAMAAGASEALRVAAGAAIPERDSAAYAVAIAENRALLSPGLFDAQFNAGRALAPDDALAFVLAIELPVPIVATAEEPTHPRHLLSARERDVLRLLVEGLTNGQIAERLFLSPRTVGAHLQRIYGKLGVSSRAAASTLAMKHDLLSS